MDKTVVELFAGVGGFHLGLKKSSDFNIIWANQWEPGKKTQHAFECYRQHYENETECVNEDIALVKTQIPSHTLLVGGFPCQDYSVASTGAKGIEGKKGVLWWEINSILSTKKPPFVLLENVDRLLKSPANQRGRDFAVMLKCFSDNGYRVEWRVINAAEYGFAQRRRRIFIFASHISTKHANTISSISAETIISRVGVFASTFDIEEPSNYSKIDISDSSLIDISETFTNKFYNTGYMCDGQITTAETKPIIIPPTKLESILESSVDESYFLKENLDKWYTLKGPKKINRVSKSGHEYIFSEGGIAFPDPLDKPARTMLTSESSLNRSTHVISDPTKNQLRLLTPVECERLNGFDDNWTNTGMPQKFRYFCMGNALVVGIIEKLGNRIAQIIESE